MKILFLYRILYYFLNKEGNIRVIDFILYEPSSGLATEAGGYNEELLLPGPIISQVSSIGEMSDRPREYNASLSVCASSLSFDTRRSDSLCGYGISVSPVSPISQSQSPCLHCRASHRPRDGFLA